MPEGFDPADAGRLRAGQKAGTIVLAVPDFEPTVGGTTRHVGLLARGLAHRGHDVVVVTRRRRRSWRRQEVLDGLSIHRVGLAGGALAERQALVALGVWLALRRRRIRVIATVMWPDSAFAVASARLLGQALVMWAIRGEIDRELTPSGSIPRRSFVRIRRLLLRRPVHIVLTPSMAAELQQQGLGARIETVPVPVDLAVFRPPTESERARERNRLELARGVFTVAYVGHLERRKAVDRLVDAVASLGREGMSVRLLVVGAGHETEGTEEELRAKVKTEGLEEVVRFCGADPDPRPYLWAADAFALPSLREGMSNSILEAMACGLPCVAPPSAGGDELLGDGAGLVPPTNDASDIAAALRQLAGDVELRRSLGATARDRVGAFSVETVVDRFESLCVEMSGRR